MDATKSVKSFSEAQDILSTLLVKQKTNEELISSFFKWLCIQTFNWAEFWDRFRPDGTMTWLEFEQFVHWEGKWAEETRRTFEIICEEGSGYITTKRVLHFKRWWQKVRDVGNITLDEFRQRLIDHFGNLGLAWRQAFDPDEDGRCCFWVFCRECHKIGIKRRLRSLWSELTDGEPTRSIYFADLDPEGDRLLAHFVLCLAVKYGDYRTGWNSIITAGAAGAGGAAHLRKDGFMDTCYTFDIEAKAARWLFTVFDKDNTRYLTMYDALTLNFIGHYDPGDVSGMTMEDLKHSHAMTRKMMQLARKKKKAGVMEGDFTRDAIDFGDMGLADDEPFEFVIELTQAEHEEYLRRSLSRRLIAGEHAHIEEKKTKGVRQLQLEARLKDMTDSDWFLRAEPRKAGKNSRSSTPSTGTPSRYSGFTPSTSRPSTPGSRGAFSSRRAWA